MSCGFGDGLPATAGGGVATGCDPVAFGGAAAPPWTLIGIASLRSVTYFSCSGSKYEKARGGRACFFSLGEITVSKVFAPLIPTSSSCLNLPDGGYLCQPCSSSSAGALTRSKFPRPEIVDVTVIGSPACTVFGLASVAIVKLPIAPEKLGGAFGGSGFTSSATGSLLIWISRRSPNCANGFEKNGSENGSSRSKRSKGERERGAFRLRGTTTCAFALTGPISNLPARAAAIAVLNVTTSKGLPLMVSRFCDDCCNFCAVNPCPVMSGGSVSLG